ncbi:PDR/VanB family oxidoreductase [Brevibacterium luteolum]|uniref:PDR/VanB family oxidoreductase n=1 Tax=Brevibacterium luteolum TaxID=199591 RepID=UPI00387A1CAD
MPELIDMKVIGTQAVCEDVMAVELERADGGPLPTWSPGSHIDIELAAGLVRQYSLCSDPRVPRTWQIAVRREPRSRGGSDFVHDQLAPGAVLRATVPINRFAFEDADAYVFIAGGIGITPLLPMLRQAWWRKKPARVYYLGRSRGRLPFVDIVEELCDDVTVHESAIAGRRDIAADLAGLPAGARVYACGPDALLDGLAVIAEQEGFADRLHTERFVNETGEGVTVMADDREFLVETNTGTEVRVPVGCSVLEALEGAGYRPFNSCREGICGSCETDVLAGVIDHRDSLLSEAERQAGDTMMICVSRCTGDRLVLDI